VYGFRFPALQRETGNRKPRSPGTRIGVETGRGSHTDFHSHLP
jgi:hypothetical protein